jgi:hypothetical protein
MSRSEDHIAVRLCVPVSKLTLFYCLNDRYVERRLGYHTSPIAYCCFNSSLQPAQDELQGVCRRPGARTVEARGV